MAPGTMRRRPWKRRRPPLAALASPPPRCDALRHWRACSMPALAACMRPWVVVGTLPLGTSHTRVPGGGQLQCCHPPPPARKMCLTLKPCRPLFAAEVGQP